MHTDRRGTCLVAMTGRRMGVRRDGVRSVRKTRLVQGHRQMGLRRCGPLLSTSEGDSGIAAALRAGQPVRFIEVQRSIPGVRDHGISGGCQADSAGVRRNAERAID